MANPKPTPPASNDGKGRGTLPWERADAAAKAAGGNGGLTDTANAHALQQIKGRIHRRLLERLNLSNLDRLDRSQVAEAIRKVVHDLISHRRLLSRSRDRMPKAWQRSR